MNKKPIKFYPNQYVAKISKRKEERNDDAFKLVRYDTWEEAQARMVLYAEQQIKLAMRGLQRAINYQRGVLNMRKPDQHHE